MSHRVLDVSVPEVGLQCPRIRVPGWRGVAASVPELESVIPLSVTARSPKPLAERRISYRICRLAEFDGNPPSLLFPPK
jgi:hypothetical protein